MKTETTTIPLTEALIKSHVADWIGGPVDPENADLNATIVAVTDKAVRISIRSGKKRSISFQEIIGADKVMFDCRASGRKAVWTDFRDPNPAIEAKPVNNYSYVPPLAKRVRKQIERAADAMAKELESAANQLAGDGTFEPTGIKDARERILSSIVRRRGQPAFRKQLLVAYKVQCAISGCRVESVLEAAHIVPYMGPETNRLSNGLLLRADLHTLFDLGLLAVDATTMCLLVSPKLADTPYDEYRGKRISVPDDPARQPSRDGLEQHRQETAL